MPLNLEITILTRLQKKTFLFCLDMPSKHTLYYEKREQNGKLKAKEEEIEKLQKMVNERDKKIRMHEKKGKSSFEEEKREKSFWSYK